jgi:2'-5' RNA ligase
MTESIRAFLALEIPQSLRAEVEASRQSLRAELPRARWVRAENQHLTLKFLGETPHEVLSALSTELEPRLAGVGAVTVRLGGSGFFPSQSRPRVAWLGGEAEGVDAVVEVVEEAAARHGFDRERRPWSLHLTQARLDRPWPVSAIDRFLAWGQDLRLEPFVAREVVLFSSVLQREGAVYTALERMPLV